jgi:transposase-like protein
MRFPIDVILVCIRWYAAYPLSYRQLEEMMQERGVAVDHSSINRWTIRFLPLLEKAFRNHRHAVGNSWRMDETYIKVKGVWKYLYRTVDKDGKTVDFLLTAKRDAAAARRFFVKAMRHNAVPDKVTMDKSGANQAALEQLKRNATSRSRPGRSNTSTTSWSKITARSNALPGRCWVSNPFERRKLSWLGSS